jgi:hypothetical protein
MADTILYWTKTGGKRHESKIHLSSDDLQPFCGLDTFNYEFQGKAIDINENDLGTEYTAGTSVYQTQKYIAIPSSYVCKRCLQRALAK